MNTEAERLTLAEAGRVFNVSPSTLRRWGHPGVKGRDGERHRLELQRIGGRDFVTRAALDEFLAVLNERDNGSSAPAPRSASRRQRESEAAARELESAGVK